MDRRGGTLSDPYLRGIYDADGNLIDGTTDDDDGVGRNSRVWFTAPEDATYYVSAGAYPNSVGTYTLSVLDATDDFTAGTDTTGAVAVGGSTTGEIETYGDQDWFAVTLEAGKVYQFDLKGSSYRRGHLVRPATCAASTTRTATSSRERRTDDRRCGLATAGRCSRRRRTATYYVSAGASGSDDDWHLQAVGDGGGG